MSERLETKKYIFTVEGETERWYAIRRADAITVLNESDEQRKLQHYKGYAYYRDNPALSIHEAVRIILTESGVL